MTRIVIAAICAGLIGTAPAAAQDDEPHMMEVAVPFSVGQPFREAMQAWEEGDVERALIASRQAEEAANEAELDAGLRGRFAHMVAEAADQTGRSELARDAWLRMARLYEEADAWPVERAGAWARAAQSADAAGERDQAGEFIQRSLDQLGSATPENWQAYMSVRHLQMRFASPEPEWPEGFVDAEAVYRPNPPFGGAARREEREGAVLIRFDVDVHGRVDDLEIVETFPPDGFDLTVRETLARWQYEPATVNGEPVRRENFILMVEFLME